jgi:hypothetical protein
MYCRESVTWIPSFEEGRSWEDLKQWELLVERFGYAKDDLDGLWGMEQREYKEEHWEGEVRRVVNGPILDKQ